MTVKEDLRVKRTKKALTEAFIQLLSEKSFEEITVNELCSTADIRRATFYKHYTDKFDFLTTYTRSLQHKFDGSTWNASAITNPKDYYVEYARNMASFLDRHAAAIDNLINSNIFPTLLAIILEHTFKETCIRLETSVGNGMELPASVETVASMATGAVASAIYVWLVMGKKKSADEIAVEIGDSIASLMKK